MTSVSTHKRQSVAPYEGLRKDKSAAEVRREVPDP
jgi:hypothetical protein